MKGSKNILSTKYFILLSSLNESEIDALIEFCNCKSFNTSIKIATLINHTTKTNALINKEDLYILLFPKTNYDDRKIRNILSKAFRLIHRFLAIHYFDRNRSNYENIFIAALKEKKLEDIVENRLKKWKENLTKVEILDDAYFNNKMNYDNESYQHEFKKKFIKENRNFIVSSKEYNNSLEEYFLLKKMKLFISSFNSYSMLDSEEEFTMIKEISEYIASKDNWSITVVIYYNLLMLNYKADDEKYYQKLKTKFNNIDKIFRHEQRREIYLLILNYTIKKINRGELQFLKDVFDLFKLMIENDTIYENGILSQWSFKNIVTVALRVNEIDWCNNFIEEQKKRLDKKDRRITYLLIKAKFFFQINDFENALLMSKKVRTKDLLSVINAKIIQIKSLYELDEFDKMITTIESLDKILIRNKNLSKLLIKRFKNFSKLLKAIIKSNTKTSLKNVLVRINKEKTINNKKWLIKTISKKQ